MTSSHITRSIRSTRLLAVLLVVNVGLHATAYGEGTPRCRQWLEKVTEHPTHAQAKGVEPQSSAGPSTLSSDPWAIASLTDTDKVAAIECLLGAENDQRPAGFSGATRLDISQTFAPARVNLAALYLISYMYSGHYDHAGAVALRGDDASYVDGKGNYVTTPSAIRRAYRSYRVWFAKVRRIGLAKAQQAGLQPLEGSGLRWY
jgi:hypothetical protein